MAKSTKPAKNESKSDATAYCMKCKTAQPVKDVVIDTKNGKNYQKGICTVCGTKTCKIVKA